MRLDGADLADLPHGEPGFEPIKTPNGLRRTRELWSPVVTPGPVKSLESIGQPVLNNTPAPSGFAVRPPNAPESLWETGDVFAL